jgi:amino acid transporter
VRFLVELYRIMVLGCLALVLIAAAFIAFSLGFGGYTFASPLALPAVIGIAVVLIAVLGFLATFIAIHDRLAALTAQAERIADTLERSAAPRGDLELL